MVTGGMTTQIFLRNSWLLILLAWVVPPCIVAGESKGSNRHFLLSVDCFSHYIDFFNRMVPERVVNHISNRSAWNWMRKNIPFFECPDKEFETTYYYRWWTYRKHLKYTPKGFIVTEFLHPVSHATEFNAVSCAAGHHFMEGRWLASQVYLDDYARFWLTSGPEGGLHPDFHQYSGWMAYALWQRYLVQPDLDFVRELFETMVLDFRTWEKERRLEDGLFWQYDVWDGMEESVSGSRTAGNRRPTINSYMYGNAWAVSQFARLLGRDSEAETFRNEALELRRLVQQRLWDPDAAFFKTLLESGHLAEVRELIGFTPWYFMLPEEGFESAWGQIMDPEGFYAPYGLTTAERRHPGFRIALQGDDCQWNGPSWPFSTSITLTAMANLLQVYRQDVVSKRDYFTLLQIYSGSQRRKLKDGRVIPWIDENLHPFTGEWLARKIKILKGRFDHRGDHYNHSTFCDLVISGLVGLRPRVDDWVEVNPLLPEGEWKYFALDGVPYHGHVLTIFWDEDGLRYRKGKGLHIWIDGREAASAARLGHLIARLPKQVVAAEE